MDDTTIRIECEGNSLIDIHDLHPLQGNLKELSDKDYEKLKKSILTLGFSDPFTVWVDPSTNLKYIHDGHERQLTLLQMEREGYIIPQLPASYVLARDKREAKKKLLANDSQYGKITPEGLNEFIHEEGFELSEDELSGFVAIDEFDYEQSPPEEDLNKPERVPSCEECTKYHANNHQPTQPTEVSV